MNPAVQNLILHEIVSPTLFGDVLWVPPTHQTGPYSQQTEMQNSTGALAGACKSEPPRHREVAEGRKGGARTSQIQGKRVEDVPALCETSIKEIPVNATKCKYPQHCSQCPAFTQPHLKGADWCHSSRQPSVARVTLWALLSSELMKSPLLPSVQELRRYYRLLTSQDMAIMESRVAPPL